MRKFTLALIFLSLAAYIAEAQPSNDHCSNAIPLCANSTLHNATNVGATTDGTDPNLPCGIAAHTVWFTVTGIKNGTATITVSKIDDNPGLSMQAYTGTCGSLDTTGQCATANGPNGSMNITFATTTGTVYYIMVSGVSGNQEAFDIVATSSSNSIIARPIAAFIADPTNGCIPLTVDLSNASDTFGGTLSYQWKFNSGPYISASSGDTTVTFSTAGQDTITYIVSNLECGSTSFSQEVDAQDLFTSFSFTPAVSCIGTSIQFNGLAVLLPDSTDAAVNSWSWNFGDPGSGANDTSTSQNPTHTFIGPGTSFNVQLIVQATCGPDTINRTVTVLPQPVLIPSSDQTICQGSAANLNVSVSNATNPITYTWSGLPTITCPHCDSTTVTGLSPGGPYTYIINITDAHGCVAEDSTHVTVNPTPVVNASPDTTVCKYSVVTLSSNVTTGIGPFTYKWLPSSGLNNSNFQNPTATITASIVYCVTATDPAGCKSNDTCININVFIPPAISAVPTFYCSSDPGPYIPQFTVTGAHPLSTYSWTLSPSDSLITSANADSSVIGATLPTGVVANYTFTVIVNDPVTGCADTVTTIFPVIPGVNLVVSKSDTICNGSSATLTASGATTYAWTASPAYAFADSTQPSQTVSPVVTTIFIVTGTEGVCSKTDSILVKVNPLPIAAAAPIPPFCGCSTVDLNGTGSSGGPKMIYSWTSAHGSMIANPTLQFTTAMVCSTDTFTLTVTDTATGCSKSVSIAAISGSKPAAVANVTPPLICNGVSTIVSLNGTGSDATGGTTYHWASQPAVVIADTTALITIATVTGFTVFYLTVTNAIGCDSIATDTVNVYPPPVVSSSPGILCTSSPSLLDTISISGPSPGSTYNWTTIPPCVTPHSTSAQSQPFDFSACGVGTDTFTVVVTDGVTGCVTTLNIYVNIVSGVTLVTHSNQPICQGDSLILSASGANSYLWNTGATTDTIVIKGLTPAMSPDTFTVVGKVGLCIAVDTVIVTIHPTPLTDTIIGLQNVCENTSTSYSVTNYPGNIYNWTVTGAGDSIVSGQNSDSIIVAWGAPGPGTVTVHQTNAFGCAGTDTTIDVTINPKPVTSPISGSDTVCNNTMQVYSVSSVAGSTYQWFVTGGVFTGSSSGNPDTILWGAGPTGIVQVVETNGAGCEGDTVSLTVTILPPPATPVITGPNTLCADSSGAVYSVTHHAGSNYVWTVSGGTIVSPNDSNQITVKWGNAGTDTIQVIETNTNGCPSAPAMLVVVLDSVPAALAIRGNISVCPNDTSVIYTVDTVASLPGNIYTWTVTGDISFFGQGSDSVKVNWGGAGTGTIIVSETNSFGCAGRPDTLNVTINPKPVTSPITPLSGKDTACANSTQQYFIDSTAGSTYQWTIAGGTISGSSNDTIVNVIWGSGPTGIVKVIETSSAGCVGDTDSLSITILPAPALPVISGADTLCANTLGAMDSVVNNLGSYYLWTVSSGGTIVSPNDSSYIITVNWGGMAGSDTITVIEVNANGCPGQPALKIVTLDSVPSSPIIGDTSVCISDSVLYWISGTPGNTYSWTVTTGGSIISGQSTDSIMVNWAVPGTDTITITETAPGGCSGQQQLIVIVHLTPDSTSITGPDSVCAGSTDIYIVKGDSASTFAWHVTNGTIVTTSGDSVSIQWGTPGIGVLQVTETSLYLCSGAPVSLNVTVNPIPVTSPITGNDTICISDTANVYSVTADSGSTYIWTSFGGVITGGQGTDSIIVKWNNPGSDSVTVVETNGFGCAGVPVTKIVFVTALPFANASASKITLCQLDTVQLTGVDSNAASVNWYTNGSGSFNDSAIISPIYTAGATDSGTVILTFVVHNPPCANDSAIITLTVNPIPHVSIAPSSPTICLGDTDSLTVSGIGSYLWTPGNDTTSMIIVHPDSTTTYNVKVSNSYGCSAMDTVTVTVIPPGTASAGPDQSVCLGDSVHLNGIVVNAGGGVWTSSDTSGKFVPNQFTLNAIYVPGPNDTALVQLVLTTTGACRNGSDTLIVNFGKLPSVNAGPDQTIAYRDSAHLQGTTVNAGGIWTSSGTGFFVPSDTTLNAIYVPSFTDLQKDSIIITLTSTNGCKIVSDFMVIHFTNFTIPNVFTPYPNTPGFNDFFEIKGLPPDSKLKVWNRWGLLVFESADYRNDWDGENVDSGVYYYVLNTPTNEYHGWVEVIR